ncbi:hypothetical protein Back11_13830 [Paenibacillus baekrokdamisoli]|uniref:Uncharacterized protein n=1 Tax=Paenibacillus baekrokdamisoli TaxID=1712516 RepID=A0A3G9J886_9BACL|nr:DUF3267 domain-containing protein [Paenibacillus baekrokdamisoli]MBB3070689.1 hypothetical protein [Paenibacillus baekrokdamisoli]BBH20038.1 hypothetical protein Back11_13830 [Paenibacillus baekrokdamisoli]
MKIIFHIPKANPEKQAELVRQQWMKLKEPQSMPIAILFSIPFMILAAGITLILTSLFHPIRLEDFGFHGGSITFKINILYIIGIFVVLIIHELIHLVLVPNFMKSNKTWIGIQLFGGFVLTEEVMSRNRFVLISLSPFLVISIILPIIFGFFGWLNPTVIFLFFLNAMGSSVDLLSLTLILFQVPKKALIINCHLTTYWKLSK